MALLVVKLKLVLKFKVASPLAMAASRPNFSDSEYSMPVPTSRLANIHVL